MIEKGASSDPRLALKCQLVLAVTTSQYRDVLKAWKAGDCAWGVLSCGGAHPAGLVHLARNATSPVLARNLSTPIYTSTQVEAQLPEFWTLGAVFDISRAKSLFESDVPFPQPGALGVCSDAHYSRGRRIYGGVTHLRHQELMQ